MATILNDPGCATTVGNTATPSCDLVPKNIIGAFLVPDTLELTSSEVLTSAAFVTKMQTLMTAAAATRAYPLHNLAPAGDNSEVALFTTNQVGDETFVREGKYKWTFELADGGAGLLANIRTFNMTKKKKILFYDSDYVVYGTKSTTLAGGMKGFKMSKFFASHWKANDGANPAKFTFDVTLADTKETTDQNLAFLKLAVNPAEVIKGVIDVDLLLISQTPLKANIQIVERISRTVINGLYSTELTGVACWIATKAGAEVTVVSSVYDADLDLHGVTLTGAPAGAHVISLSAAATLEAQGVGGAPGEGYESSTVDVTFVPE